ncbi:MAG TPA: prolyl oligopeptidase family serine peptidase [Vicinamibacterales bacterium]|nr:prolyl oligopeptidase family serine peptidase [Vicinamibacterales bacterium]
MKSRLLPVLAACTLLHAAARAQPAAATAFTLDQVLSFPFADNLVASPAGARIAWTFNERGARNIYVADGPSFQPRRITPYTVDDGQELTNLSFARDGRTIVYVRGGDHGANWTADGNVQPNPTSVPVAARMQVFAVAASGGTPPKLLGDGDEPAIAPAGDRVAFVHDRRIWIAPLDGSAPAAPAFFARGASESPVWSPDGRALAFVSNRDDHSFIGIFTDAVTPIRYLAVSTSRDSSPMWSLEGRAIAFVRQPGRGGVPRSPLVQQPQPWSIVVADAKPAEKGADGGFESWKSGKALVDSIPRTQGEANLHWAADDHVVFLSYQDGWPHVYAIHHPGAGGRPALLTPGPFMVEHVSLTPDGKFVVYSANTGSDPHDIDRRHLFKVPVDGSSAPVPLTRGAGIEWSPVVTGDGQSVAFLGSTAQRPSLPAVMPIGGGEPRPIAANRIPATFPQSQLVTPEPVTFASSDGLQVHGQVFKTAGGAARRPALVYVHGGPPRQMLLGFHYMDYYANDYAANQYLASRGFVVLSVNYRLGIGYGFAFHNPEHAGQRGASEYLDVAAAGRYLQSRPDVDAKRIGIWGGSYGGYLAALALGRNSDIFAAGVDIHGVHDRIPAVNPEALARAIAGDGISETEYREALKVAYESSPIAAVPTWRSPVLLIHGDDDRNVQFHQTVDLKRRLLDHDVRVEELVVPDDIHDFLLFRSWKAVTTATGEFFERQFTRGAASQP